MTTRCVLTGDLVRSTGMTEHELDRARNVVLDRIEHMATWKANLLGARPEFFRGDSWQALLMEPGHFLRACVVLRASLKGANEHWDTRIAVGLGGATKINKARTSLSAGEAFLLSGRALDGMSMSESKLVVRGPDGAWSTLNAWTQLCSAIIDGWTVKQAQVAALALSQAPQTMRQAEIADHLGITQQAVSKSAAGAQLQAISDVCRALEDSKWNPPRFI